MYYWLALNDQFRLIFIPKSGDVAFFVFTIIFVILFILDILVRSFVEKKYFFNFFFFVDIFSVVIIIYSSWVSDISIFITLSFLKIIMIVRVTHLVLSYKAWVRSRLMKKVKAIKRQMKALRDKSHKNDRAHMLKKGVIIKTAEAIVKKHSNQSLHTVNSSKRSLRVSRYSAVNIAMLNSMRTHDTQQGEELENTLGKQTKLEKQVIILFNDLSNGVLTKNS